MSYQKVIFVGNLTKDGELKYTQGGQAIYNNSIAITKKFTSNGEKKEKKMFIDIASFSKIAEICNQYLRKGSKVLLEGEIEFQQWVDQNGGKRSKHSFSVSNMQMLDSKSDNQQAQQPKQKQQPQYEHQQVPRDSVPNMPNKPPEINIDSDEIPF